MPKMNYYKTMKRKILAIDNQYYLPLGPEILELLSLKEGDADTLDNIFTKVGIDQKIRAENLSLENWHSLFAAMDDSVL